MTHPTPSERNELWDRFLELWPAERVAKMTLPEYIQAHDKSTFAYWLEFQTKELGSISGGSAMKFGIFHLDPNRKKEFKSTSNHSTDGEYAWYSKYGNTREEAFEGTRQRILKVIEAAQEERFEEIATLEMGRAMKWKIASLYQDRESMPIIPFFIKDALRYLTGSETPSNNTYVLLKALRQQCGDQDPWEFYQACVDRWEAYEESQKEVESQVRDREAKGEGRRYWTFSPGQKGALFDSMRQNGVITIGWDFLGDLSRYADKAAVEAALNADDSESDKRRINDTSCCYGFAHEMQPGDVVFAKIGQRKVIGRGTVLSNYAFNDAVSNHKHQRKMRWETTGEWVVPAEHRFGLKTLSEITQWPETVDYLLKLTGGGSNENEADADPEAETLEADWSPATNLIHYGPPGTGKTYFLQEELIPRYQNALTDSTRPAPPNFEEYPWWQVVAAALHLLGGKAKPKEILHHPLFQAKATFHGRSENLNSGLWVALQMHSPIESKTVKTSRRSDPSIFDKTEDTEWYLLEKWQDECPEALELAEHWKKLTSFSTGTVAQPLDRYLFVTFHPSYAYEDFIEGMRPVIDEATESLVYQVKAGPFRRICAMAKKDPAHRYALFIDEINRGNIAKIFGELITLIESDKRCRYDAQGNCVGGLEVVLPHSGEKFGVPTNVDLYGTMNTADRSIALLDLALRRRFRFQEMPPQPELIDGKAGDGFVGEGEDERVDLRRLLHTLNRRLLLLKDADHLLGHSYFMKCRTLQDLRLVLCDQILPLLQEYFYDDFSRILMVLGERPEGRQNGGLVRAETLSAQEWLIGGADGELSEKRLYRVSPIEEWSAAELRRIYGG